MYSLSAYEGLPFTDQMLHHVHFMLCCFAVLIASLPLLTLKGSTEHKFGGALYLPVSFAAFFIACVCAWREQSLVLLCFNVFCAYLMLSGWRAPRLKDAPALIDWIIPGVLFVLSAYIALYASTHDDGMQSFYLLFFACNGFILSVRDFKQLGHRAYWSKHKQFLVDIRFGKGSDWLNRHIAGMAGSVMANMSVVALTLLPLTLHWIWPVTLVGLALYVAMIEKRRQRRVHAAIPAVLRPKFGVAAARRSKAVEEEDLRRAA